MCLRRVLESKARHLHEYMYRMTIVGGGRLPMLLADEHELYKAIGKMATVSVFTEMENKIFEQRTSNGNGAGGNHGHKNSFLSTFYSERA